MSNPINKDAGTIYVDLDGTLAHYEKWEAPEIIGQPIAPMMDRVRDWVLAGKRVKIFTARFPEHHGFVREWLLAHGLGGIEVTNVKGIDGYEFWDDRAVHVQRNTGYVFHVPTLLEQLSSYESDAAMWKDRAEKAKAKVDEDWKQATEYIDKIKIALGLPMESDPIAKIEDMQRELEERRAEQAPITAAEENAALRKRVFGLEQQLKFAKESYDGQREYSAKICENRNLWRDKSERQRVALANMNRTVENKNAEIAKLRGEVQRGIESSIDHLLEKVESLNTMIGECRREKAPLNHTAQETEGASNNG